MDKVEENIKVNNPEIEDENKNLALFCMQNKENDALDNVQAWLGETYLLVADDYDHVTNTWTNLRSVRDL